MRHAYLSDGIDLDALRRFARAQTGEQTQIHKHPFSPGLPDHTKYEVRHAVYDCSEIIEGGS